jgi:hypothetical protein
MAAAFASALEAPMVNNPPAGVPAPAPPPGRNVQSATIPGAPDSPAGLEEIYAALVAKAETAMGWYETRQRQKKRGAHYTRGFAIVLGAITAVVPSIIALLPERVTWGTATFASVRLNPVATIFGVAAATMILLDKFYGYSSSWMRYVTTYQEIQASLEEFRINWRKQILKLNSNLPPTDEQVVAVFDLLASFLKSINDSVRSETQGWIVEFKGALADIDKTVEAQKAAAAALPAAAAKGAINVVVTEWDKLDDRTWTLQIDNRKEESKVGQSSAAIPLLDPGIYKVRVAGKLSKAPVAAEFTATVESSKVTTVDVKKLG